MEKNLSNGVDRISNLPLHLQHHILSSLPPQNMVQTSLLSKNWTYIWCSVPHLQLSDSFREEDDRIKSHNFVDSLLLLRDVESKILKFRLNMQILIEEISKVNAWISYALKHNVEVLDLSIYTDSNDPIKFIPSLFACQSLKKLTLNFCDLNLPAHICLPALRFLKLNGITIQNGKLFSGLRSLETLILGHGCFIHCSSPLKISATQLKSLKMDVQLMSSLVISAPNLVSLELYISPDWPGIIGFHGDMVYLDDAVINIEGLGFEAAVQLLSTVKNARSLLLTVPADFDCEIIEELRKFQFSLRIQFQFSNLKLLRIEIMFRHSDFVFINKLLAHSPQLESLFLSNTGGDTKTTDNFYLYIWFKHELSHLKLVEVHGFDGTKGEVEMVEFFLENAIVLERLIILTSKAGEEGVYPERELTKIGRKILTYPRASSSVGILFTPIDEETLRDNGRRVVF